jgi:hypothetical protein
MLLVTLEADNPLVLHLNEDPATYPAVGANALD